MKERPKLKALPNLSSKKSRLLRKKPNKKRLNKLQKMRMRMIMDHKMMRRLLRMATKMLENSLVMAF